MLDSYYVKNIGPDERRRNKWDARRKAVAVLIGATAAIAWVFQPPSPAGAVIAAIVVLVAALMADTLLLWLTALGFGVYMLTGRTLPEMTEPTHADNLDLYRAYLDLGGEPIDKYERMLGEQRDALGGTGAVTPRAPREATA